MEVGDLLAVDLGYRGVEKRLGGLCVVDLAGQFRLAGLKREQFVLEGQGVDAAGDGDLSHSRPASGS